MLHGVQSITWDVWTQGQIQSSIQDAVSSIENINSPDDLLNEALLLQEGVSSAIEDWPGLSNEEQNAWIAQAGVYIISSAILIRLSFELKRRLVQRISFLRGRLQGTRSGPIEPYIETGFIASPEYKKMISRLGTYSGYSSPKEKRWVLAHIRRLAFFYSTQEQRYLDFDVPSYISDSTKDFANEKFRAAYEVYRQRKIEERMKTMPRQPSEFKNIQTPYLDEVVRTVVDVTYDSLPRVVQMKLISYLYRVARNYTRPGRPQTKLPFDRRIRDFLQRHKGVSLNLAGEIEDAVKHDLGILEREAYGIIMDRPPPDDMTKKLYGNRVRARFNQINSNCKENIRWLGSMPHALGEQF